MDVNPHTTGSTDVTERPAMDGPDKTHRAYHTLRADLLELHGWAESALNTDHDRQCIAEHLTRTLWALLTDVTPPIPPFPTEARTYTHPDVLTIGVRDGWADPETDPRRIDWTARQAAAAIPFEVINGRPVNPCESTGIRHGRNQLGHWGEALAADAMVTATDGTGARWLLMVERSDGHGWALPGGFVEPDEDPEDAAVRELSEETCILLPDIADSQVDAPRYVPDPRASDEAWMVTVLTRIDLGTYPSPADFPPVHGSDDAARAAWLPAHDYRTLTRCLAGLGAEVFPAHRQMLADALAR
ncbi:NUDIX domain-containing protein [Couchioplanes azureus]|uniref:NUDIX domain-containing protein n=1 Tax=Couchioplanes caeruleus TaxID=56438 RepID=UPI0019A6EFD7|nr:NUDIX domain-containing protein [Couchioplanes caeruleus]GGQ77600.1 hypothetical protein GCM10010166_54440 [Couchioplanes caeruleus subsp. azureus]